MVENQPRPDWSPVPRQGTRGVEFRVLLRKGGLLLVNLKFDLQSTIDEHSAPYDIDVVCVSGSGFTSIGGDEFPIEAGQTVRWPAGMDHRLWTEDDGMETIMLERYGKQ